jgi:hypothetical protein
MYRLLYPVTESLLYYFDCNHGHQSDKIRSDVTMKLLESIEEGIFLCQDGKGHALASYIETRPLSLTPTADEAYSTGGGGKTKTLIDAEGCCE